MTLVNALQADPTGDCPEPLNTPNCFNSGNLHTHGLHVSPAGNSDNVLISVDPQTRFPYRYNLPSTHPSGTFWYHSHRHGSTALSVTSGMEGVLIVKGDRKYQDRGTNDGVVDIDTVLRDKQHRPFAERVLLFQQIGYGCFTDAAFQTLHQEPVTGKWLCDPTETGVVENYKLQFGFAVPPGSPAGTGAKDVWSMSGRYTAINGVVQPVFRARVGDIERWRMVHGGVRDTLNVSLVKANDHLPSPVAAQLPEAVAAADLKSASEATLDAIAGKLQSLQQGALKAFVDQSCGGDSAGTVSQYEIAVDGLTRHTVSPKALNILNPGQRSDALVAFRERGIYCLLDQAGPSANTIIRQGGRLGSKSRSLLGIVVVSGTRTITEGADAFIEGTLDGANQDLPAPVRQRLRQFDLSDFAFAPPSVSPGGDLAGASIAGHPTAEFAIMPLPPAAGTSLPPNQPQPNTAISVILGLVKNTSVTVGGVSTLAYDHDVTYQASLGTVDEWTLGVTGTPPGTIAAPHVFHIHVNPFEVMDITDTSGAGQSIFDASGACKPIYQQANIPDPANPGATKANPLYSPEYCDQRHIFRDTIFVKPGFLVTARTAYDDFIGEYVLHCHILDHEDQGMMQNVTIVQSPNQEPAAAIHTNAHAGMAMP